VSATRSEIPNTEGVLLIRQGDKTMAVHLAQVTVILEAIAVEHPDVHLGYATLYGGTSIGHYEVEASGKADRLYMWAGTDPFAKPEVEASRAEVEA
jgi:hypothetical protein